MAIQAYVPTEWFDNTAPAINAANLNHIEQGILNVTEGLTDLESEISRVDDDITALTLRVTQNENDIIALRTDLTAVTDRVTANELAIENNAALLLSQQAEIDALQTAPPAHTHPIGDIVDLQTQLNRKPNGSWNRSGSTLNIDIEGS